MQTEKYQTSLCSYKIPFRIQKLYTHTVESTCESSQLCTDYKDAQTVVSLGYLHNAITIRKNM